MKFTPYTSASDALMRKRLIELAMHAPPETANSALIVAPAGYGKTTLLSQLQKTLEASGEKTAWLNCGSEDSQPDVFLANLGRCLQAAGLFEAASEYGVGDLMAALAAKGPAALLIDEYENATSEGSDNVLEIVIRTLPASCKLFIATRELPKISLTKLMVDGRTRLINAHELRFNDQESNSIISGTDLPKSYSALLAQSEGWPVMVQLARLDWQSSSGQQPSALPGLGHRARIFDYLAEQILTKMEPLQRDFLLEISVLSEVDVPSAQAVTENTDAEKMLRGLLRLHPIVMLISEQPFALRLHPLFRDFLRHDSINFSITEASILHRRAALYFAARKDLSKAIDHASKSGSSDLIVQLLENAGGPLLNVSEGYGRVRSYLATLSPNLVSERPRLRLMRIMQHGMEGTTSDWINEFERFLEKFNSTEITDQDEKDEIGLQIDLMQFICEVSENKRVCPDAPWPRVDSLRQKCLARKFDEPRYMGIELPVELMFITDYGSLQLAEKRVDELRDLFESANFTPNFSWISNHLASINFARGDLVGAEHYAKICLDRIMDSGETRNTLMRQHCNAILGECYFEQNNFDLALAHFSGIPKLQAYVPIITFVSSVCTEARIRFHLGDGVRALADLEEAYQFAIDEALPHFITIGAATVAEFRLLLDDVAGCESLIVNANLEKSLAKCQLWFSRPWFETEALVRLFSLFWIRQQQADRAYDLANEFAVRATQSGRRLVAARAEILTMGAALTLHRTEAARAALLRAIDCTAGSGVLQPFLNTTVGRLDLLEEIADEKDLPHRDWVENILNARGKKLEPQARPYDMISPREKDVLIGLCHGHPSKIIARELNLSHETVRHHLKKIYTKLRVHTREQAVEEARRRGLVI